MLPLPTPTAKELIQAQCEAEELATLIENTPECTHLKPRIDSICAGIDEAYETLMETPEYAEFSARLHELSLILKEAKELLAKQA